MDPQTDERQLHRKNLFKGIFFFLLTWLFFTTSAALSRFAVEDAPLPVILFFQNLIALGFVVPWIGKHGIKNLKTNRFGLIFLRSLLGVSAFGLLYLAISKISFVNAILLNNAAPLYIPIILFIWKRIRVNWRLWPGIILGFIGVGIVLGPDGDIIHHYSLFAGLSGILLAIVMIIMRMLSHTERNHTVLFYLLSLSALLILPLALIYWQLPSADGWWFILGMGAALALGQLSFFHAFHFSRPSVISPFSYSAILYSIVFNYFFWGKVPVLLTYIGAAAICLGGIYTIVISNKYQEK